jgi:hypothetical protein
VTPKSRMSGIPVYRKIKKYAPFDLSAITREHPYFAQLLAPAIGQLKELPDFSEDTKIAVMSDFGGEHKGASFNTYSFLIMAYNKVGPFQGQVEDLRRRHDLTNPYSEFAFKDLTYGPRSRALPEFLRLVNSLIHGAVITIAIDKTIGTVFGKSKQETTRSCRNNLRIWGSANGRARPPRSFFVSVIRWQYLPPLLRMRTNAYCGTAIMTRSTKMFESEDSSCLPT